MPGPVRDVVVLNAAAALVAYGKPQPAGLGRLRRRAGAGPGGNRLRCGTGQAGGVGGGYPGCSLKPSH